MKKFIVSIIILIVSIILSIVFIPFGLGYAIGYRLIYKKDLTYISKIFIKIAVSLDQLGNVICGDFFDIILTRTGKNFGLEDDTVSEVISRNKYRCNLTKTGTLLANTLESIDPDHLEKALEENTY